jgi:hypothetical protein
MNLFKLLKLQEPAFEPHLAKVHLARYNQIEEPIDVYRHGGFEEWQRWQNGNNFTFPQVVALIDDCRGRWMFAGLFLQRGFVIDPLPTPHHYYTLDRMPGTEDLEGRLFCVSAYKFRQSYVHCSTVADMKVVELLSEKITVGPFPGFKQVKISKDELDLLVRHNTQSWRTALSSVKGIYLITDTVTGKLYVGKADGESGIWGRWCQYSNTGHGHNKALVQELGLTASERQRDLHFSLLEVADLQSTRQEILDRESHWKDILMSRSPERGYNRN